MNYSKTENSIYKSTHAIVTHDICLLVYVCLHFPHFLFESGFSKQTKNCKKHTKNHFARILNWIFSIFLCFVRIDDDTGYIISVDLIIVLFYSVVSPHFHSFTALVSVSICYVHRMPYLSVQRIGENKRKKRA